MTFNEAIKNGYTLSDTKLVKGYLSRKVVPALQPVKVAKGKRNGDLYVEIPHYTSTKYYRRFYLKKEGL